MKEHILKCDSYWFLPILSGRKTFEVRKNDREFEVGDTLTLVETINGVKTGNVCSVVVKYLMSGGIFGIDKEYVVMSIEKICYPENEAEKL